MSGALPRRDTTEDKPRHQTPFKQQLILGSLSRSSSATNSAKKPAAAIIPPRLMTNLLGLAQMKVKLELLFKWRVINFEGQRRVFAISRNDCWLNQIGKKDRNGFKSKPKII